MQPGVQTRDEHNTNVRKDLLPKKQNKEHFHKVPPQVPKKSNDFQLFPSDQTFEQCVRGQAFSLLPIRKLLNFLFQLCFHVK